MAYKLNELLLTVGTGVAKGALKLWLKDEEVLLETGSSIVDLLKLKTSDLLARRSGYRQFEEISEKVAKQLIPLFDESSEYLDEEQQNKVVGLVGRTLDEVPLTPEIVLSADLNPQSFAMFLKSSFDAEINTFSIDESNFYDLVLSEASQFIIDISSDLPSFTEKTFGEILKRERALSSKVDRILEAIDRISAQTDSKDAYSKFENAYRRTVSRNLDEITLFGTDLSDSNKRYKLSVAYISLHVQQRFPSNQSDIEERSFLDKEIQNVESVLLESNRLLVTGAAGSGKTTLLQWIAVKTASRSFEDNLSSWNEKVPFYIRLREFADKELPRPENFPSLVSKAISDTMPEQWTHKILEKGQGLILIDGIDEVSEKNRNQIRIWIKELLSTFPDNACVVTTRPYAVQDGWLQRLSFEEAELQDMTLTDIKSFIEHWHDAIKEELNDRDHDNLELCKESITEAISQTRQIQELATNPLLCAMLCALNRERNREIPNDRIELYNACYALLLHRREAERGIQLSEYPKLSLRQKQVLLEDVAYWLIKNGYSEIDEKRLEKKFEKKATTINGLNSDGQSIKRFFLERSGLLKQPVPNSVNFAHKTFQEFLAAKAILDEDDIGVMIQNCRDDQWREVIILAAGLARKKERELLIKSILEQGNLDPKNNQSLYFLAIGCLETVVEISEDITAVIKEKLNSLVPPKNITQAKALAKLGDLVVPYFKYKKTYSARNTAASVRTLSLINSELSNYYLKNYLKDHRSTVWAELCKAKSCFESTTFYTEALNNNQSFRTVISNTVIVSEKELEIISSTDWVIQRHIPELSYLITNYDLLRKFQNLKLVNIIQTDSTNFNFVQDLVSLEFLSIRVRRNQHLDFSMLPDIKKLRSLRIYLDLNSKGISSLEGIEKFSHTLELLYLPYVPISDFSYLKRLKKLVRLSVIVKLESKNKYGRLYIRKLFETRERVTSFLKNPKDYHQTKP